jgi:hypothetical protein
LFILYDRLTVDVLFIKLENLKYNIGKMLRTQKENVALKKSTKKCVPVKLVPKKKKKKKKKNNMTHNLFTSFKSAVAMQQQKKKAKAECSKKLRSARNSRYKATHQEGVRKLNQKNYNSLSDEKRKALIEKAKKRVSASRRLKQQQLHEKKVEKVRSLPDYNRVVGPFVELLKARIRREMLQDGDDPNIAFNYLCEKRERKIMRAWKKIKLQQGRIQITNQGGGTASEDRAVSEENANDEQQNAHDRDDDNNNNNNNNVNPVGGGSGGGDDSEGSSGYSSSSSSSTSSSESDEEEELDLAEGGEEGEVPPPEQEGQDKKRGELTAEQKAEIVATRTILFTAKSDGIAKMTPLSAPCKGGTANVANLKQVMKKQAEISTDYSIRYLQKKSLDQAMTGYACCACAQTFYGEYHLLKLEEIRTDCAPIVKKKEFDFVEEDVSKFTVADSFKYIYFMFISSLSPLKLSLANMDILENEIIQNNNKNNNPNNNVPQQNNNNDVREDDDGDEHEDEEAQNRAAAHRAAAEQHYAAWKWTSKYLHAMTRSRGGYYAVYEHVVNNETKTEYYHYNLSRLAVEKYRHRIRAEPPAQRRFFRMTLPEGGVPFCKECYERLRIRDPTETRLPKQKSFTQWADPKVGMLRDFGTFAFLPFLPPTTFGEEMVLSVCQPYIALLQHHDKFTSIQGTLTTIPIEVGQKNPIQNDDIHSASDCTVLEFYDSKDRPTTYHVPVLVKHMREEDKELYKQRISLHLEPVFAIRPETVRLYGSLLYCLNPLMYSSRFKKLLSGRNLQFWKTDWSRIFLFYFKKSKEK